VLMAMFQVVLRWQISTTHQIHNCEPIVMKFGEGDNVTGSTNPAKFDEDRFSGCASPWWWNIRVPCLLFFLFLYSLTRLQPKPLNRFQCTIAQKTRTDSRKCPLSKCFPIFSLLLAHFPRKPLTISLPVGKSHANNKMSNNFRFVRVRTKVTIEHL